MKKLLLLILCVALALTLASCGGCDEHVDADKDGKCDECGETVEIVCTEHKDDDDDVLCDICGEVYVKPVEKVEVNVSFVIKDQGGDAVPGVTVTFTNKIGGAPVVATADDGGAFSAKLEVGSYRVSYDYDADAIGYYLADTTEILVSADTTALTLNMINNNPNGTAERPYIVYEGENEYTIAAGSTLYYRVPHVIEELLIDVMSADLKVAYAGEEYLPVSDLIHFTIAGEDTNTAAVFAIENTASESVTFVLDMYSHPGAFGNPYKIEDLSAAVTTGMITKENVIYYTYIATADGDLTLSLGTDGAFATMTNNRNSVAQSTYDAGSMTVTIAVQAGDEISINCSTASSEPVEVTFTLALVAAAE